MTGIKGHIFRTAGTIAVSGMALVAGIGLSIYAGGCVAAFIERMAYR